MRYIDDGKASAAYELSGFERMSVAGVGEKLTYKSTKDLLNVAKVKVDGLLAAM